MGSLRFLVGRVIKGAIDGGIVGAVVGFICMSILISIDVNRFLGPYASLKPK